MKYELRRWLRKAGDFIEELPYIVGDFISEHWLLWLPTIFVAIVILGVFIATAIAIVMLFLELILLAL